MSYLLRISYGPVQSFISASRKTRDLKAGSELLIELGRTILDVIEKEEPNVEFIFPSRDKSDPEDKGDCANVLLVQVDNEPKELVKKVKQAATEFLVAKVKLLKHVDANLAEKQARQFLEFYAAWAPLNGQVHEVINQRLAARKMLREFDRSPSERPPLASQRPADYKHRILPPKSPLLPEFDTVLLLNGLDIQVRAKGRYQLKNLEYLDALSLVKRDWGTAETRRMPSTRMVAVRHLVELLTGPAKKIWEGVENELKDANLDHGDWLFDQYDTLNDDGEPLLGAHQITELQDKKQELREVMKDIEKFRLRPYYAIIHADGDRMGKAIDELTKLNDLKAFSRKLDSFGKKVKATAKDYCAQIVFAGGDDVLALVPMPKAIKFAKHIHQVFAECMKPDAEGKITPTLSVGIAVVHATENLSEAVALSVTMEHYAKAIDEDKDAIAICIRNRGGGETTVRTKWSRADVLENLIEAYEQETSPTRKFPYEIRDEAQRLCRAAVQPGESHIVPWVVKGAYERIRKKKENNDAIPPLPEEVQTPTQLQEFAEAMVIAHFLTRGGAED